VESLKFTWLGWGQIACSN